MKVFVSRLVVAGCSYLIMGCLANCGSNARVSQNQAPAANSQPQRSAAHPSVTPALDTTIRSVDFGKVSYPNFPDYSDPRVKRKKTLRLDQSPTGIQYDEVTGDGVEDAIIAFGVPNRGSATPGYVYIFTVERGKPKLLWDFLTGDRADGGLKSIYADKGTLVIELYGRDRYVGGELYKGDEPLCCPTTFTRSRYEFKRGKFVLKSREVLPNDE